MITRSFIALAFTLALLAPTAVTYATPHSGYGGGGTTRVEVCRETGSRFLPYIKVTVPSQVATQWVASGKAVWPVNGQCPRPQQTLRDFLQERLSSIFDRFPFLAQR